MRAPLALLLLNAALTAPLGAASSVAWLAYPASSRNLAQAGGLGVLASGAESLGLNPAGIADLDGTLEAQLGYGQWPANIDNQGALVSYRAGDGGLGLKFNYVDFGVIQGYSGGAGGAVANGSLHPNASDAALGGGWRFGDLAVGAGIHWLSENLTGLDNSTSPAFECGAKLGLTPRVVVSAALLNAGSTLNGSGLPTSLRVGAELQSLDASVWNLGIETSVPLESSEAGASLQPDIYLAGFYRFNPILALLGGLGALGNNGGVFESLGVTAKLRAFSIDYGFRTAGDLGVVNELSLRFEPLSAFVLN